MGCLRSLNLFDKDDYKMINQESQINDVYECLKNGDLNKIKELLAQDPSLVNMSIKTNKDVNEMSLCEIAMEYGFTSLVKSIINNPAFDFSSNSGALLRAAINLGYFEVADELLFKGANPNELNINGVSVLYLCMDKGNFSLAQKMIDNGAEIDRRDKNGWTALIYASYLGKGDIVDFLLKNKASVNICNNDGWNAIVGAYSKNHYDIAEKLLNNGAVFSEKYAQSAMLNAYISGNRNIAVNLLNQNTNPNYDDGKSESLIILAAQKGDYEFVKLLLEHGADPNSCEKESKAPVMSILAEDNQYELIKLLVKHGADVNLASKYKITPIYRAVKVNSIESVEVLASLGANVNTKTDDGSTPLIEAVTHRFDNVVQKLIELKANPFITDDYGNDAFYYANQMLDNGLVAILGNYR